MEQIIIHNTRFDTRLWTARMLSVVLIVLLFAMFIPGLDSYYKLLVINSLGLNPSLNHAGEIQLSPIDDMPAAESGLEQGDVLLAVNHQSISSNASPSEIVRDLKLPHDKPLVVDVQKSDGTKRQVQIALESPIRALFGLSAAAVAQYQIFLDILLALGFAIPALIIFWLKSKDKLGIFVSVTLLLTGFRLTSAILYTPNVIATMLVFLIFAVSRIFLLVFLFIFPDGRYVPTWTRRFVFVGGLWAMLSIFTSGFYELFGQLLDAAIFATGLWSQIYRYRRISNVHEQQQTKWIVFGITTAYVFGYLFMLIRFVPAIHDSALATVQYQLAGRLVSTLSLLAIPVTVMISIFRYRLYEIDIIINRALVYSALTTILSGMYIALIGFFSRLFIALTGQKTEAVTVLTTIIVVSAMTPIKNYLQSIVDKSFKETHDANRKLKAFIEQIRTRLFSVNIEQITRRLLEESVLAFDSDGGAVYLKDEKPTHTTRAWDGREQLKVHIGSAGKNYGILSLGKRVNGAEYTDQDRSLIQEVVKEIALAIEQDQAS